jgi:hypothetical protein
MMKAKIATATLVASGSITALMLMRRPIVETKVGTCIENDCEKDPKRGDQICQVRKGEADPFSANFDPASCGYCGDGIRQVNINGLHGSDVRTDENGIRTQDVIQRPSETPAICPADFTCGDGKVQDRAPFGAWIKPRLDNGPYSLGIIRVSETKENCKLDTAPLLQPAAPKTDESADDPILAPKPPATWFCPNRVASSDSINIMGSQSASVQNVLRRLSIRVTRNREKLREALGVKDPETRAEVTVVLLVSTSGALSIQRVSAKCGGVPCGDRASIVNATGLNFDDILMTPPDADCTWTISFPIPRD